MDFTPTCPAPRERVCDSDRELLGLRVALSQTGPSQFLRPHRGSPRKARSPRPWAAGMAGRGCPGPCTGVPRSPRPRVSPVCHPRLTPAAAASAADTVWVTKPARAVPSYWRALRSVPLSLAASRARTQNSNDPASGMCRRTSRLLRHESSALPAGQLTSLPWTTHAGRYPRNIYYLCAPNRHLAEHSRPYYESQL